VDIFCDFTAECYNYVTSSHTLQTTLSNVLSVLEVNIKACMLVLVILKNMIKSVIEPRSILASQSAQYGFWQLSCLDE